MESREGIGITSIGLTLQQHDLLWDLLPKDLQAASAGTKMAATIELSRRHLSEQTEKAECQQPSTACPTW